jgi:hypothetical protein
MMCQPNSGRVPWNLEPGTWNLEPEKSVSGFSVQRPWRFARNSCVCWQVSCLSSNWHPETMNRDQQRKSGEGGRTTTVCGAFAAVVNVPVLLSLLFVLQFVPVEHIPCLLGYHPVQTMDCHRGMSDGVQMLPAQESGWAACCRESIPVVFTIPAAKSKQVEPVVATPSSNQAKRVMAVPNDFHVSAWPPGHSSSVRSFDRSVVFASFLI